MGNTSGGDVVYITGTNNQFYKLLVLSGNIFSNESVCQVYWGLGNRVSWVILGDVRFQTPIKRGISFQVVGIEVEIDKLHVHHVT